MKPSEHLKKLVIIGAGGAGVEALWVAQEINARGLAPVWEILGFSDENPRRRGERIDGLSVVGTPDEVVRQFPGDWFHVAVGTNKQRRRIAETLEAAGLHAATLVDPRAVVAPTATIGGGSYVGAFTVIAPHAQVGRHVLINASAGIGHHAIVGDFAQVCPGARVNGGCMIDREAFIGSNAVVHPKVNVGEGATVGAASFVIRSVAPRHSVVGVPARIVSRPAESRPNAQK